MIIYKTLYVSRGSYLEDSQAGEAEQGLPVQDGQLVVAQVPEHGTWNKCVGHDYFALTQTS